MSEIPVSFLKGIYPYFNLPAVAVMIYLYKTRQWCKAYTLLLVVYAAANLLILLQIFIADQTLVVSRRYLLPLAPVLFIFTALFWELSISKLPAYWQKILLFALAGLLIFDAYRPALKDYTSRRRREKNTEIRAMAQVINRQLSGQSCRIVPAPWYYEPRFPARAIIKNAPVQLGYLTDCQIWNPYFPCEPFAYLVQSVNQEPPSEPWQLIYKGIRYKLYTNSIPESQL